MLHCKISHQETVRVYLAAEIRNWTFWEFGSTYGYENLSVGKFCQVGKNGTSLFEIGHQRAAFILKLKYKVDHLVPKNRCT